VSLDSALAINWPPLTGRAVAKSANASVKHCLRSGGPAECAALGTRGASFDDRGARRHAWHRDVGRNDSGSNCWNIVVCWGMSAAEAGCMRGAGESKPELGLPELHSFDLRSESGRFLKRSLAQTPCGRRSHPSKPLRCAFLPMPVDVSATRPWLLRRRLRRHCAYR
jgi:hypothetical protein